MVWNSWCFRGWKKCHRQSILKKSRFAWLIHLLSFDVCWWIRESHWRECVSAAIEFGKKRWSVWRRRIYRKYVSWNRAGRNSKENVVLSRSCVSPGQWFRETEYLLASAIFVVGTSGIPPNLNYRSVSPIVLLAAVISLPLLILIHSFTQSSMIASSFFSWNIISVDITFLCPLVHWSEFVSFPF